eukprot:306021-Amphidinium_carterae.2
MLQNIFALQCHVSRHEAAKRAFVNSFRRTQAHQYMLSCQSRIAKSCKAPLRPLVAPTAETLAEATTNASRRSAGTHAATATTTTPRNALHSQSQRALHSLFTAALELTQPHYKLGHDDTHPTVLHLEGMTAQVIFDRRNQNTSASLTPGH